MQALSSVSRQTPVFALALVALSGLFAACGRSDDDWRYEEISAGSPRDNLVGIWTAGPGWVRAFNHDGDLKWLTLEGRSFYDESWQTGWIHTDASPDSVQNLCETLPDILYGGEYWAAERREELAAHGVRRFESGMPVCFGLVWEADTQIVLTAGTQEWSWVRVSDPWGKESWSCLEDYFQTQNEDDWFRIPWPTEQCGVSLSSEEN